MRGRKGVCGGGAEIRGTELRVVIENLTLLLESEAGPSQACGV